MKKLILIILFFNLSTILYSQWLIFPQLPSDQVNDIYFINNSEIIFINNGGGIFKSSDGGITWYLRNFYSGQRLDRIYFLEDGPGFITSRYGDSFFYSNDMGNSWQEEKITTNDAISVLPFSKNIIIKSTNIGIERLNNFYNSWDIVYHIPYYTDTTIIVDIFDKLNKTTNDYDIPYGSINKFQKLPSGNVIAIGNNLNAYNHNIIKDSLSFILTSKDTGLTWDTLWIGLKECIKDICFSDDLNGWMISDTSLYNTTNGGLSWQKKETGYNPNSINYAKISCKENNVYLLTYGNMLISTDFGNSWINKKINIPLVTSSVFNDSNNGFVLGNELIRTTDGGNSWKTMNPYSQINIYDLNFISTKVGIALSNGNIYKTYDGGHSWSAKFSLTDFLYSKPGTIKMIDEYNGWLITYNKIYKTKDKGENWEEFSFPYKDLWFGEAAFYDSSLAIISATEESIPGSQVYNLNDYLITVDGGVNWKKVSSNSEYFKQFKFTDPTHLWAKSETGLWVSNDSAATWKKIYPDGYYNGNFLFDFADSLYGVITFAGDEALYTNDGGKSWKPFSKPIYINPYACKIIGQYITGSQRIMEAGQDGKILLTYLEPNGRVEYASQQYSCTGMTFNTIDVLKDNDFPYVWIGGDGFSIVYRQYEKIVSVKDNPNNIPLEFNLSQNYPNPFNPSTVIDYSLPVNSVVSLKIYDILGREINTLVNAYQNAGLYKINFNAESLPSGIYFYQLHAGDFTQTKKMVFIK